MVKAPDSLCVTFVSRSAVDFASALDVIWPFFAGLLKDNICSNFFNPLFPKSDCLVDFTLSNARRFYSSKGDPLGLKGLKSYLLKKLSP